MYDIQNFTSPYPLRRGKTAFSPTLGAQCWGWEEVIIQLESSPNIKAGKEKYNFLNGVYLS